MEQDEFAPFNYPPFTRKRTTLAVVLTCIITLVVGTILLSVIMTNIPLYDLVMEGMQAEVATKEQEEAAMQFLMGFGIGFLILICLTVGGAFAARAIKLSADKRKYENQKSRAYAEWQLAKERHEECARREEEKQRAAREALKDVLTCKFCGGEMTLETDMGTLVTRSYVRNAYDVKITGYNTAQVTPGYDSLDYQEYAGGSVLCRCKNCQYEIKKQERSDHMGYGRTFPITVELYGDCKLSKADVMNTKAYQYVRDYNIKT